MNYISDHWCECVVACDCEKYMDEIIESILSNSVVGDDFSHLSLM